MRTLYLHVGMHKTGTTSIQQTLHRHQPVLAAHGLSWFPAEEPNHSRTVFSAFTEQPHLYHVNRRAGLHRPEDAAAHAAACRDRLHRFLAEAPGPGLLISGEDIAMLGPGPVARMLAAFRPLVDRIVVVGMVRPPRAYVASALQQRVRGGDRLDRIEDAGVAPRYRFRFAPFLDAPEVAATILHPYTPATLDRGCSVATLLRLVGADPALYPKLAVDRANTGGSHLGLVLALAANEAVPVFLPDGRANPERAPRLVRFLDSLEGPRFVVPEALIAPRLAGSADDIAWMEARLGAPFDEPPAPAEGSDPQALDPSELRSLARAINGLVAELQAARTARRPAEAARGGKAPPKAGPETARPAPAPGQEARRVADQETRRAAEQEARRLAEQEARRAARRAERRRQAGH